MPKTIGSTKSFNLFQRNSIRDENLNFESLKKNKGREYYENQ